MEEEKMIQIPEWQLKDIEDVLRMSNNINHSHLKETCFDRCAWKAWGWTRKALGMHDVPGVNVPREYSVKDNDVTGDYPDSELVRTIAGACLKHEDSGEGSHNKAARVIIDELEKAGFEIKKK